jgi:hypothetical protein
MPRADRTWAAAWSSSSHPARALLVQSRKIGATVRMNPGITTNSSAAGFPANANSTHDIACNTLTYVFAEMGLLPHTGRSRSLNRWWWTAVQWCCRRQLHDPGNTTSRRAFHLPAPGRLPMVRSCSVSMKLPPRRFVVPSTRKASCPRSSNYGGISRSSPTTSEGGNACGSLRDGDRCPFQHRPKARLFA